MAIAVTAHMRHLVFVFPFVLGSLFGCGSDDSGSSGNPSTGGSGSGGSSSGGTGNTGTGGNATGGSSTGGASTGGAAGGGVGGTGTGGSGTGGSGATGGGGGPLDNPDNYAAVTNTFRCASYDQASADPAFKLLDIAALTHQPTGGWNGSGVWQLTPHPIPGAADDNEGLAGWKWWPEAGIAPGSTEVLVVSYLLLLSPQFVTDVKTQHYPAENYGGCKTIDLQMWNDAGTATDYDTRQIVLMSGWRDAEQGLPAGGIYLAHVNGGAGGGYVNDGVNSPLNLAEHPGEWVWISHVFDARAGQQKTVTYYKRPGDPGVTRSLVRPGDLEFNFAGTYEYTSNGWAAPPEYNSALWGYWGAINFPHDDDRYVKLDGMCSGDGWLAPPF